MKDMRRKNRHEKKPNVSLAHKLKYYFVRPDEDIRVLWNPGNYIARYVALILKDFIPYSDSLGAMPCGLFHFEDDEDGAKEYQAWHDCLEEMLFAFEQYANDRALVSDLDEETQKRVHHGLDLFAKYFDHLWN